MNTAFVCEGPSTPPEGALLLSTSDARRIPRRGPLLLSPSALTHLGRDTESTLLDQLLTYRPDLAVFSPELGGWHGRATRLSTEADAAAWLEQGGAVLSPRKRGGDFGASPAERLTRSGPLDLAVVAARYRDALGSEHPTPSMQVSSAVCARHGSRGGEGQTLGHLVEWHDRALGARSTLERKRDTRDDVPIAAPLPPEAIEGEIRTLPRESVLLDAGAFLVVAATSDQAPSCVREIGRLRELTFRRAGEGTGLALDLDPFDDGYTHLFVFDKGAKAIAGAYRIGDTAHLLSRGAGSLYTSTLFDFEPGFWSRLGPALELGRSFVCPEYQKSSRTLLLLWRGIGVLVQRSGHRHLFGPVSISAEYTDFSRDLMAEVLGGPRHRHPLAGCVTPRTPNESRTFGDGGLGDPSTVLAEPSDLSLVVSSAEADGKGLPVLVREYLKLGGRFLGFNVDATFASVLDGLVAVDLADTDPRLLAFYMGKGEAESFLSRCRPGTCTPRA